MRNPPTTNSPAAAAYAAYIATLQARRPASPEAAIEAARAEIARVISAEAAAGAPGTGCEILIGLGRDGSPVTRSGMKPGTPYALISRREGRRIEICQLWPCGTLDSAGPACFSA